MSNADFVWSYDACRKMDSLARKAYKQITGDVLPASPVNHRVEQQPVELLPIEQLDIDRGMRIGCGTPAGWTWHRRNNEKPCQACRLAHNKKTAEYRARQRAKRKAS
jgi:hypothetical protein